MTTSPDVSPGWRPGQVTLGTADSRLSELLARPDAGATKQDVQQAIAAHKAEREAGNLVLGQRYGLRSSGPSNTGQS